MYSVNCIEKTKNKEKEAGKKVEQAYFRKMVPQPTINGILNFSVLHHQNENSLSDKLLGIRRTHLPLFFSAQAA